MEQIAGRVQWWYRQAYTYWTYFIVLQLDNNIQLEQPIMFLLKGPTLSFKNHLYNNTIYQRLVTISNHR